MNNERRLSYGKITTSNYVSGFANNRAYVIGVNAYSNGIPTLRTAVPDAERLGRMLEEFHRYQVRSFPRDGTPSLANLQRLLHETLPHEVTEDDRVLLYFAGHGIALDGEDGPEGFLVPEDAYREDRASFLAMTELHDALAKLPCRHLLLILDCCFAGAFRWSSTRAISTLPSVIHRERYERYIQDPAWQVLASAAHDQTAWDVLSGKPIGVRYESDKHSPFATALFRALAGEADLIPRAKEGRPGGDGVITATELYLYLRDCVETATVEQRTRQTPMLWPLKKHDKGEYILLTPGHELNLPPAPELSKSNNPYRGLQSFDEEHREFFFGRTRVIEKLCSRVAANALTVVLGASGTGKSSVVKAGLVPALRTEGEDWQILPVIRPGKSPLANLASVAIPGDDSSEADRLAQFWSDESSDANALADRIMAWAKSHSPSTRLLLVVDQFEELVTLCCDDWERARCMQLLESAVQTASERFRLVITLRSDFEPQFIDCPLKSDWTATRYVVPPMTTDELREAIEGPASARVLYFQPAEMIDRLINEVIQAPGAMPLLSFTLSELYIRYLERRAADRCLTDADYESLGGVVGSLRSIATELYDDFDGPQQATMERIMLRMVSVQGGELARRRVPRSELIYTSMSENDRVSTVLEKLSDARLVVEGKEVDGEPYVEPAHDALIRGWGKLLEWTRKAREQLALRHLLTPAAVDWEQHAGGLWLKNPRLDLAARFAQSSQHWLNRTEVEFVNQSVASRRRQLTVVVGSVIATLAILSGLTIFALIARSAAVQNEQTARSETVRALTNLGLQAEEQGRTATALHHWAAAIAAAPGDDAAQSANRLRLGARTQQMFQLVAMLQHDTGLRSASFDPMSTRLVTTTGQSVKIWNLKSHELIRELPQADFVGYAEFSPDGKHILSRGEKVRIWDADSGEVHRQFDTDSAVFATYIAQGKLVYTAGASTSVWDAATGQLVWNSSIPPDVKEFESFARIATVKKQDGKSLVLRLIESQSGTQTARDLSSQLASNVAVSMDGKYLALSQEREIEIYSIETGELLRSLPIQHAEAAFSPSGHHFIAIDGNFIHQHRTDNWFDSHTFQGSPLGTLPGNLSRIDDVVFVPNSSWILGRSYGSDSKIWDLDTRLLVQTLEGQSGLDAAKSSSDGQWLLTTTPEEGAARLYRRQAGFETIPIDIPSESRSMLSPDGKLVLWLHGETASLGKIHSGTSVQLAGSFDGSALPTFSPDGMRVAIASDGVDGADVSVWTTTPVAKISSHSFVSGVRFLTFSSDGKRFCVITEDGVAHVGDGESGPMPQARIVSDGVTCCTFDPSSRRIAVGDQTKVWLWDTSRNDPQIIFDQEQQVQDVAFVNDGRELAIALFNSEVHLWDIDKKQSIHIFTGHTNTVSTVGEIPNGGGLFTSGLDNTIRIWDRQRLTMRRVLRLAALPGTSIISASFSRDGHYIATWGESNVAVWDSSSGQPVVVLPCPAGAYDVVFSPDGRQLIVLLEDQTIRIWNLNHLRIESSLVPAWVEAFTGIRINDAGEAELLKAEDWHSTVRLIGP